MIIACPVCATGFNLPTERITPKGAKLRCSKCGHVFRVRRDAEGLPEVYYRQGEEPVPALGLSVLPSSQDSPQTMELSNNMVDREQAPDQGFPGFPPPIPQADSADSAAGPALNFFEEEAPLDPQDDPFAGAFDDGFGDDIEFDPFTEFSQANDDAGALEQEIPMLMAGPPRVDSTDFNEHATPGVEAKPQDELITNESLWNQSEDIFAGNGANVDPNFGTEGGLFGPSFEQESPAPAPPASFKPPSHISPAVNLGAASVEPEAHPEPVERAPATPQPAPARAASTGASKVVTVALMACIVALGFLGVVAFKADGVIDFKRFGHMIEVAFADASFTPRPEWTVATEPTPQPPKPPALEPLPPEAFDVRDVVAWPLELSRREGAWLVQGSVFNRSEARVLGAMAHVTLKDKDGQEIGTAQAPVVGAPDVEALKASKSFKRLAKRVPTELKPLEARSSVAFWMVVPWKGKTPPAVASYTVRVTQAAQ